MEKPRETWGELRSEKNGSHEVRRYEQKSFLALLKGSL